MPTNIFDWDTGRFDTTALLGLDELTDPGGDRILFYDFSASAFKWLQVSTGLVITATDITLDDHGSAHISTGGDPIPAAVAAGASGLMTGADKTKLDGLNSADYAAAAHVGSGGAAHADVTTSVDGFMTAADKTKLDGIAAGAEVNVQADWNAVSGDSFIQNKPTIATASIIEIQVFS